MRKPALPIPRFTFLALLVLAGSLVTTSTKAASQTSSLSETMLWIANHLPERYFAVGSMGTVRQDNSYQVNSCTIRVTSDYLLSIPPTSTFKDHTESATFLKIRPSSGFTVAYTTRELKSSELPSGFRGDSDGGSRMTYTLDFRHIDSAHIEVHNRSEQVTAISISIPLTAEYIEIPFFKENVSLVPRLISAIRHAVALCGGKADPF